MFHFKMIVEKFHYSSELALRSASPQLHSAEGTQRRGGSNGAYRKHSGKELSSLQLVHFFALSTS